MRASEQTITDVVFSLSPTYTTPHTRSWRFIWMCECTCEVVNEWRVEEKMKGKKHSIFRPRNPSINNWSDQLKCERIRFLHTYLFLSFASQNIWNAINSMRPKHDNLRLTFCCQDCLQIVWMHPVLMSRTCWILFTTDRKRTKEEKKNYSKTKRMVKSYLYFLHEYFSS